MKITCSKFLLSDDQKKEIVNQVSKLVKPGLISMAGINIKTKDLKLSGSFFNTGTPTFTIDVINEVKEVKGSPAGDKKTPPPAKKTPPPAKKTPPPAKKKKVTGKK